MSGCHNPADLGGCGAALLPISVGRQQGSQHYGQSLLRNGRHWRDQLGGYSELDGSSVVTGSVADHRCFGRLGAKLVQCHTEDSWVWLLHSVLASKPVSALALPVAMIRAVATDLTMAYGVNGS